MVRKGDEVRIKPEWMDSGDGEFVWIATSDEEKGCVDIMPMGTGLTFPPVYVVKVEWLEQPK